MNLLYLRVRKPRTLVPINVLAYGFVKMSTLPLHAQILIYMIRKLPRYDSSKQKMGQPSNWLTHLSTEPIQNK